MTLLGLARRPLKIQFQAITGRCAYEHTGSGSIREKAIRCYSCASLTLAKLDVAISIAQEGARP